MWRCAHQRCERPASYGELPPGVWTPISHVKWAVCDSRVKEWAVLEQGISCDWCTYNLRRSDTREKVFKSGVPLLPETDWREALGGDTGGVEPPRRSTSARLLLEPTSSSTAVEGQKDLLTEPKTLSLRLSCGKWTTDSFTARYSGETSLGPWPCQGQLKLTLAAQRGQSKLLFRLHSLPYALSGFLLQPSLYTVEELKWTLFGINWIPGDRLKIYFVQPKEF